MGLIFPANDKKIWVLKNARIIFKMFRAIIVKQDLNKA